MNVNSINLKSGWIGAIQQLTEEVEKLKQELKDEREFRVLADEDLSDKFNSLKSASS